MDFILLRSFDNYIDSHMAMGRMEAEGIDCWLKDENTVTLNPILSIAVGGIKLMVAEDQLEKAVEILNHIREQKKQNYHCPYCDSNNIELIHSSRKAVNWITSVLTWMLGSYAIAVEQTWHCFDCSKEFKEPVELNNEQEYNGE